MVIILTGYLMEFRITMEANLWACLYGKAWIRLNGEGHLTQMQTGPGRHAEGKWARKQHSALCS